MLSSIHELEKEEKELYESVYRISSVSLNYKLVEALYK